MVLIKLKGVKRKIRTANGDAEYIGTEIEDKYGRWNDSYSTKYGEWVIHDGKYHHIYKNKSKEQIAKNVSLFVNVQKETGVWN